MGKLWVILLYCCLSFVTDNSLPYLSKSFKFYIFSAFTIAEYTLFTLFIYLSLKEKVFKNILIFISAVFYIIVALGLAAKTIESFDSASASLEASLVILYAILFFYERPKDPSISYIYYSKEFWIIIAFLFTCPSTLFLVHLCGQPYQTGTLGLLEH